ncbi:MAG: DUF4153 domain-containing protein [Eubacteriales bacterium]|jgi:hypothetical protein
MKLLNYTKARMKGISEAIIRFWAVFLFLIVAATLIAISIETPDDDLQRHILAAFFGAFAFLVAQVLCERFGETRLQRCLFLVAGALATAAYYIWILNVGNINDIVWAKTFTLFFALFVAFVWVPSIRGESDFNATFLSVFKAFFVSLFFSGIIYGGLMMITFAVDQLLFEVDSKVFGHISNIMWTLWAPMLMLSLIPVFAGKNKDSEKIAKATGYPKFLEVLLSYVLVPIASVYTLVIILYMFKTVIFSEWTDNLLEPLLLSYLIGVILIYILVKRLSNAFTRFYVAVFPVLMAAIALFQLVASYIKAAETGVEASRYYVMLFSLYSIICGVLLFVFPKKKNGYLASLAIVLALVCVTPYLGAFDTSIRSQSRLVEKTLIKNDMLKDGVLVPGDNLPDKDQQKIYNSVMYLHHVGGLDRLEFLPENFEPGVGDFEKTFGFNPYGGGKIDSLVKLYRLAPDVPAKTNGYDYLINDSVYISTGGYTQTIGRVTEGEEEYELKIDAEEDVRLVLSSGDTELLKVRVKEIFDAVKLYPETRDLLDTERLTFDFENNTAKIRMIIRRITIYEDGSGDMEAMILFSIK